MKPEAQKDIIQALRESNIHPTSMIDISDGLSSDLLHICSQSKVGCRIFQDKIPIHAETAKAAAEMSIEPFICALNGGEDYELLFTIPLDLYDRALKIEGLSVIGHINDPEAGCKFITSQENEFDLEAQGWNPI